MASVQQKIKQGLGSLLRPSISVPLCKSSGCSSRRWRKLRWWPVSSLAQVVTGSNPSFLDSNVAQYGRLPVPSADCLRLPFHRIPHGSKHLILRGRGRLPGHWRCRYLRHRHPTLLLLAVDCLAPKLLGRPQYGHGHPRSQQCTDSGRVHQVFARRRCREQSMIVEFYIVQYLILWLALFDIPLVPKVFKRSVGSVGSLSKLFLIFSATIIVQCWLYWRGVDLGCKAGYDDVKVFFLRHHPRVPLHVDHVQQSRHDMRRDRNARHRPHGPAAPLLQIRSLESEPDGQASRSARAANEACRAHHAHGLLSRLRRLRHRLRREDARR